MGALTENKPKPMLELHGRTVLEYIFDSLPQEVDEIILVVGYLGHVIHDHFGGGYKGKRIFYVEQGVLNGTAGALFAAKDMLHDSFLLMNGDDICTPEDVAACAASPDWAMLVQEVDDVGSMGKVLVDERGRVTDIQEKEIHSGGPGLANTANFFKLDMRIFKYPLVLRPGSDTEYGLPQTIVPATHEVPLHVVHAHALIRLTDPGDIAKAEASLSNS